MDLCPYRFVADIKPLEGEPLGALPFQVDFDPAVQWTYLQAVRRGAAAPLMRAPAAEVRPIWHPELGEPRVVGLRVTVFDGDVDGPAAASAPDAEQRSCEIPLLYFRRGVESAATGLVDDGKLKAGENFLYEVSAFPAERSRTPAPSHGHGFVASDVAQELSLVPGDLARLRHRARLEGADEGSDLDFPLFIAKRAISEAKGQARTAGDVESGGVLIGHLQRDARGGELFAVATAYIPASHTLAERSRLTFTSQTWADVRAAIELRGRGEEMLGWSHHHPFFCATCPPENRRVCALARPFFSQDDCILHHTIFPAPFHSAVLLTDLGGDDLIVTAYGWRYGMVMRRAYYVLPELEATEASRNPEATTQREVRR